MCSIGVFFAFVSFRGVGELARGALNQQAIATFLSTMVSRSSVRYCIFPYPGPARGIPLLIDH